MGINAAQRGAGNTKITMRTNVTSNTINILLNYLLINGRFGFPALGIHGAALATISGTVVACIMSVASIFKKESFLSIPYILEQHIRTALCRVNSHLDAVEDHTAHNNAEIYHSIIVGVCRRTAEVDDRTGKKHKYNA